MKEAFAQWFCIANGEIELLTDDHFDEFLQKKGKSGRFTLREFVEHMKQKDDTLFSMFGTAKEIEGRLTSYAFQLPEAPSYFDGDGKPWEFTKHHENPVGDGVKTES